MAKFSRFQKTNLGKTKDFILGEVQEYIGDIFRAPEGSVLIHACNCQGQWGSGIAAAFKAKFPKAYAAHYSHCSSFPSKSKLEGTTQLIEPQQGDIVRSGSYWIACLFTSEHFGRRKKNPTHIVDMTRRALEDLRKQLQAISSDSDTTTFDGKLYTVRLNSKAFNTPWEHTCDAIVSSGLKLKVMNNVDVMDLKERKIVIDSMEERGQDLANVREWKGGSNEETSSQNAASKKQPKKRTMSVAGVVEKNAEDVENTENHPEASSKKGKTDSKAAK